MCDSVTSARVTAAPTECAREGIKPFMNSNASEGIKPLMNSNMCDNEVSSRMTAAPDKRRAKTHRVATSHPDQHHPFAKMARGNAAERVTTKPRKDKKKPTSKPDSLKPEEEPPKATNDATNKSEVAQKVRFGNPTKVLKSWSPQHFWVGRRVGK